MKEKHICTVIVKDMSRVGRDYLQVGFYTEVFFREKGVRFIAVSNGVDSDNNTSSEFAPFLNIMNEWYLRDCSRKITAVLRAKRKEGKPITSNPPYGFVKDTEDKNHNIRFNTEKADECRTYRGSGGEESAVQPSGAFRDVYGTDAVFSLIRSYGRISSGIGRYGVRAGIGRRFFDVCEAFALRTALECSGVFRAAGANSHKCEFTVRKSRTVFIHAATKDGRMDDVAVGGYIFWQICSNIYGTSQKSPAAVRK